MTPQENVKDDGPGSAEGIPGAAEAGHQAQGEPREYTQDINDERTDDRDPE